MTTGFPPADRAKLTTAYAGILGFIRSCIELARSGALANPTTKDASACVDTKGYRDAIDDTLRHELARQNAQPRLLVAALSEYSSVWPGSDMTSVDDHQLDAAHLGFGDRPLIVLIHDGTAIRPRRDLRRRSDRAWRRFESPVLPRWRGHHAWHAHCCREGRAPHSVRSTGCCDRGGAMCRRRRAARHSARFSRTMKDSGEAAL